jgi:hypothetical protein
VHAPPSVGLDQSLDRIRGQARRARLEPPDDAVLRAGKPDASRE